LSFLAGLFSRNTSEEIILSQFQHKNRFGNLEKSSVFSAEINDLQKGHF
jgi:hypothetical protein